MWGSGLINGLRISFRNMLRGPITVKYPYEKLELPERARWAVKAVVDEHGAPACTACMTCVRACPDHILDLDFTTREDKTKHIEHFRYEVGACMMCGLCVEACPFAAIEMSHDYELARTSPDELVYDLLTDVDAASGRRERAAAPMPPFEEPAADVPAAAESPALDEASAGE
jgi:NADH-quinone oxidoreductase subunit I